MTQGPTIWTHSRHNTAAVLCRFRSQGDLARASVQDPRRDWLHTVATEGLELPKVLWSGKERDDLFT